MIQEIHETLLALLAMYTNHLLFILKNFVSRQQHIILVSPIAREILLNEIEWRVYSRYGFF